MNKMNCEILCNDIHVDCPICGIGIDAYCKHDAGKYRVYYYNDETVVWTGEYSNRNKILALNKLVLLDEERIEKLLLLQ